jgi:hypothetical protein
VRREAGPAARSRFRILLLLGLALLASIAGGLAAHPPGAFDIGSIPRLSAYVSVTCAGVGCYFGAVALLRAGGLPRGALAVVLGVAAAMRLMTLAAPPFLSSDIYRYVWDGRVQNAGINPYEYLPAAPELSKLRDGVVYPHINRVDYAPTIYPPVAQAIFRLVTAISPTVLAMRLAMAALEALGIAAMLRLLAIAGRPPELVAIYAWNPVFAWEYAGSGHIDAASIGCIGLALLFAVSRRRGLAGLALGAAVMCKFLPAALFPALWRRWDLRLPLAAAAVIVIGYACFIAAGWRVLGFLPGYAAEEGLTSGSGVFWLWAIEQAVGTLPHWVTLAYFALAAAVLLALAAWIGFFSPWPDDPAARTRRVGWAGLLLASGLMLAVTPHYPWYFGWIAFLACLAPSPAAIFLAGASVILYLDPQNYSPWWPAVVYLPVPLLLAWSRLRSVR